MRSAVSSLRISCAVLLIAPSPALFAGEPPPAATPPGTELRGGFTFSSTREDGSLEWKVEGSSAKFLTPDLIEFADVRAIFFDADGTSTVATSKKALLDKEARRITTDEFVTIVTENSITTGTGLDWDQEKKRGTLKKGVKVVYTHPQGKSLIR